MELCLSSTGHNTIPLQTQISALIPATSLPDKPQPQRRHQCGHHADISFDGMRHMKDLRRTVTTTSRACTHAHDILTDIDRSVWQRETHTHTHAMSSDASFSNHVNVAAIVKMSPTPSVNASFHLYLRAHAQGKRRPRSGKD